MEAVKEISSKHLESLQMFQKMDVQGKLTL